MARSKTTEGSTVSHFWNRPEFRARVAWVVAALSTAVLMLALGSFHHADWPSQAVAVHNNPPANLFGNSGAAVAYWTYAILGFGTWFALLLSAAAVVAIPFGFRPQHLWLRVIGTAILVAVIFALTSAVNNPPLANTGPLIIGLLVVAIGLGWGANAGYAINPARDFGPRLASFITGYHDAWFSANGPQLYFWVPIVAPIIGGLIGGGLFVFCIERFLPAAVGNPAEIGVVEPTPLK